MAEKKKTSAMIPLILVGAGLFGFGIFQSVQPKAPEVNTGFVAPPQTPMSPPQNPRTMQAPDAPAMTKDAAQEAADADVPTTLPLAPQKSVLDDPWFSALKVGDTLNFRERALAAFKKQQGDGVINCRPALTRLEGAALAALEEVSCTATDGSTLEGRFEQDNDGEVRATSPDNQVIRIEKSGDEFNVRIEAP